MKQGPQNDGVLEIAFEHKEVCNMSESQPTEMDLREISSNYPRSVEERDHWNDSKLHVFLKGWEKRIGEEEGARRGYKSITNDTDSNTE